MSTDTIPVGLKRIPLFADLDENKLREYLQLLQPVSFYQGDCLMTQGEVADSIFFLEEGAVDVVTTLPGDSEMVITTLGPGSVIGEMALLDDIGTRTATVRALTPTNGFLIERQDCRTLLTQAHEMTFTVQHRITLSLCQRLRELFTTILNFSLSFLTSEVSGELDSSFNTLRHSSTSLAYKAFLPQLPFFSNFRSDDIDHLLTQAAVLELSHEQVLFRQGNPGRASFIIIRGAVELVSNTEQQYPLGVLGPGHICGQLALIDNSPHEATAVVRSHTVLLELSQPVFKHLFTANTRTAAKFQHAIMQSLLTALAKADNHLTRLMSQSALRTRRSKTVS